MRRMSRVAVVVGIFAVVVVNAPGVDAAKPPKGVQIVGSYVNDAHTCSSEPGSQPGTFAVACRGGSVWQGGWTGKTYISFSGTFDSATEVMRVTYREWFFGRAEDGTEGGLLTEGWAMGNFLTNTFEAHASIVRGVCGFEGSKGTADYYGGIVAGGFTADWIKPKTPAAAEPGCVSEALVNVLLSEPPVEA